MTHQTTGPIGLVLRQVAAERAQAMARRILRLARMGNTFLGACWINALRMRKWR